MIQKSKFSILIFIGIACVLSGCNGQSANKKTVNVSLKEPFSLNITVPQFREKEYNLLGFGAVPDSVTMNTSAFRKAIETCSTEGGGKIIIPKGVFLTGPIHLKSNIELHLEVGAEIKFSNNPADYLPAVKTRWEGIECYNYSPLIYAADCENIAITGKGKINGNGEAWWAYKKTQGITLKKLYDMVINNVAPEQRILATADSSSYLRPSLIQFYNCKNIFLENFNVRSGPMWTIHFVYSKNVYVKGVKVVTKGVNNDGIIPDSSEDVLIEDCYFSTGDDCIVIKSGLNEDGWRVNKPCKNIVVRNCTTNKGHGGVVMGSEMSGGVENVFVNNCTFNGTGTGIRIKSMRGRGGYIKNLYFDNIKMDSIKREVVIITFDYGASSIAPRSKVPPTINNVRISNISCTGAGTAIRLIGLDESKISGVSFKNFTASANRGIELINTSNILFQDTHLITTEAEVSNYQGNSGIRAEQSTINNKELLKAIDSSVTTTLNDKK